MISLTNLRNNLIFQLVAFLAIVPASSAMSIASTSSSSRITADQLGQLFIFGFHGQALDANLQNKIIKYRPGGFLFFKHNMSSSEQIRTLTHQIRQFYKSHGWTQPLLLVDQEGGLVTRLPSRFPLPSAATFGMLNDDSLTYQYGVLTGQWLRWHGFDMNLAPVLDIAESQRLSFIGSRSYGYLPSRVSSQGLAFAKGLLTADVLPTAKHFPGLGGIAQDPHRTQVIHPMTIQDFTQVQIPLYKKYFELQPSAIMMSHLIYKNLDSSMLPATFSQNLIQQQLEKNLNYRGLIISDDLLMEAAKIDSSFYKIPTKALMAGIDMQMLTWSTISQKMAFESLYQSAQKNPSVSQLIQKKSLKIRQIKNLLFAQSQKNATRAIDKQVLEKKFHSFEQQWLTSWMGLNSQALESFRKIPAPLLVISTSHFYSQLRYQLGQGSKFLNIANLSGEMGITQKKALQQDYKTLAIVYGEQSAKNISSFFKESKSGNLLIVNLGQPGLIEGKLQEKTLALYSNPPSLADRLGVYLSGK
jgi:beta-glucosidase-like glycosyl hydrolase